tara:strand:- start:1174 stop:1812 length:639 start_codon:yes stop_codon:yes gene_type:complete
MRGNLRLSGGTRLLSPKGKGTRPTSSRVREAVMNILGSKLDRCSWLDLFSGSGIVSCEAIQRGAKQITAVEKDRQTARICTENIGKIISNQEGKIEFQVIKKEVLLWLESEGSKTKSLTKGKKGSSFDLVYIDPPYITNLYNHVLNKLLSGKFLRKDSIVICEYSSKFALNKPDNWTELDRRSYGSSSILLVSPPESLRVDTDSKLQQRDQE